MAQVILFRPREIYSERIALRRPPLGLLYIAPALQEAGFSVKVIDSGTCSDWKSELEQHLDSDTICAGITCMTGHQIRGGLEFSKYLKKQQDIPVVWGGLHPSLLPEQTMQHELVDYVLTGEGEERMPLLVKCIQNKTQPEVIPGIWYRENGEIKKGAGDVEFLKLDNMFFPAYDLLDNEYYATQYRRFMGDRKRCLCLNTDRGCPFRCAYCYNLRFNRRSWRAAPDEIVLDRAEELKKRYNLDAINFVSDNFFVDKDRLRKICQGLIERKLDLVWHADMRIDTFMRYDDETLQLMRDSGCTMLTFGVESGSPRMLKEINKDITVESVLESHERLQRLGFAANYHFMIGFPDETREDAVATMKLMRRLANGKNIAIYGPSIFLPFPGTPLFDRCLELGFTPPESLEGWADYDWELGSKLPWFDKKYKAFLQEVYDTGSCAFEGSGNMSMTAKIKRSYFRLRFLGLIYGVSTGDFDRKLIRAAKKILGK